MRSSEQSGAGLGRGAMSNEVACWSQVVKGPSQGFGIRAPFLSTGMVGSLLSYSTIPKQCPGDQGGEQSLSIAGKEIGGVGGGW